MKLYDDTDDETEDYRFRFGLSLETARRHKLVRECLAERGGVVDIAGLVNDLRQRGCAVNASTLRSDLEFLKQTAHW